MSSTDSQKPEESKSEFVFERSFNASRALVFQALSNAEHLVKWWSPKSFMTTAHKFDFKPGGSFHYCMEAPKAGRTWGKFVYRDIHPPERIVFINSFSDQEGSVTRAPFNDKWPMEILNILTLDEDNGETHLTLRGGPIGASEEERQTYADNVSSMHQGFAEIFDNLDSLLIELKDQYPESATV